jgi:hypothetical protein
MAAERLGPGTVVIVQYGTKVLAEINEPVILRIVAEKNLIVVSSKSSVRKDGRQQDRISSSSSFSPLVMAPSPAKQNDIIHFKVENFNASGMLLSTSLRNKFLLPGSKLEAAQLIIPGLEIFIISFQVRHTSVESGRLMLGIQFLKVDKRILESLAQYSMSGTKREQPGEIKALEKLSLSGLPSRKIGRGFTICVVSSADEYADVLKIRLEAYRAAGKATQMLPEEMADEFDERSIILCAKAGKQIVGTVRLVYSDGNQPFPFEEYFAFPKSVVSKREDIYEVSRLAIDPSFQGTDLVLEIFKAVAREVTISKVSAFCLATQALRSLYLRLGANKITGEVNHPVLPNETLALFELRTEEFLEGKKMRVMAWDMVAKEVFSDLVYLGFRKKIGFSARRSFLRNIEKLVLSMTKKKKKSA